MPTGCVSLSARRAWIEIHRGAILNAWACSSLSARRAWIEILLCSSFMPSQKVALRKESVDRNSTYVTRLPLAQVALRKESVDRNTQRRDFKRLGLLVALRKESVDRNIGLHLFNSGFLVALRKESVDRNKVSTLRKTVPSVALRKESVDRNSDGVVSGSADYGRSPQGERG